MELNVTALLDEKVAGGVEYASLSRQLRQVIAPAEYTSRLRQFAFAHQLAHHKSSPDIQAALTEKMYYSEMLQYCRENMLLYPYRFVEKVIALTGVLPFPYYQGVLLDMMKSERSYDALPNFTAVDCLRLTAVGRNQYIDMMNQARAKRRGLPGLRSGPDIRKLVPQQMNPEMALEPWWRVRLRPGLTNERVRECCASEQEALHVIRRGFEEPADDARSETDPQSPADSPTPGGRGVRPALAGSVNADVESTSSQRRRSATVHTSGLSTSCRAGECYCCMLPRADVHSLHSKGYIYVDVNIENDDSVVVPTITNFVMNRTTDDPFEKLLYDILVSVDDRTTVQELSVVLDKPVEDVRTAAAIYCRLGLAYKKAALPLLRRLAGTMHKSWTASLNKYLGDAGVESPRTHPGAKRIAFLFDSELAAYLMMGNLGPALKDHAVTLYEAGKMTDELLDDLVDGLLKISAEGKEGEVRRYYDHAVAFRFALGALRHNPALLPDGTDGRLDLIRSESLNGLDTGTRRRILDKNYAAIISMTPVVPLRLPTILPYFYGSPISLVSSPWFRLFVAVETGAGPRMLLLRRGTYLRQLPRGFGQACGVTKVLMLTWALDVLPAVLCCANALPRINEELMSQPVLLIVQEEARVSVDTLSMPFPHGPPVPTDQLQHLKATTRARHPSPTPPQTPEPNRGTPTPEREDSGADPFDGLFPAPVAAAAAELSAVGRSAPSGGAGSPAGSLPPLAEAVSLSPAARTGSPANSSIASPMHRPTRVVEALDPSLVVAGDDPGQSGWNEGDVEGLPAAEQADRLMRWLSTRFLLHCSIGYVQIAVVSEKPGGPGAAVRTRRRRHVQAAAAALRSSVGSRRGSHSDPAAATPGTPDIQPGTMPDGPSAPPARTRVYPVNVFFGLPLAEPALTERMLAVMEEQALFGRDRMELHAVCMHRLAIRFMSFIDEHRGGDTGRMMYDDAGLKTPVSSKLQSPVVFPSHSLIFDGSRIVPLEAHM